MIASVNASQTYTDILSLNNMSDSEMFPILNKDNGVVVNKGETGSILYVASTPYINDAFQFDSDDDCMIVTRYTVTAGGTAEVRNYIQSMAAADEMLTPIVKNGEVKVDSIDVKALFELPGTEPTDAPVEPTTAEPTDEPVEPTTVEPTDEPVEPTTVEPTDEPVEPTTVEPTDEPVEPTDEPTEPIVEPTDEPTEPVVSDKIIIDADGNKYVVEAGTKHTYSFYLNNGGVVCSLDAKTTWDITGILIDPDQPTFPILSGEGLVVNDSKLAEGVVIYNYSDVNGAYFDEDGCQVITFSFLVPEDTQPGIYKIRTEIKTLAGADEEKQIFNGVDFTDFYRKEGVLDGEEPYEGKKSYVSEPVTYIKGSGEDKDFIVKAKDGDDSQTVDKFAGFTIDDEIIGEDCYKIFNGTSGELIVTLKAEYLETLDVKDYKVTFNFTDGSVNATLTVADAPTEGPTQPPTSETPSVAPTTSPSTSAPTVKPSETTPASKDQATTASSSTNSGSSTTNSSTVKTGSPEFAIIFMVILLMAAGVIVFMKKRKND